MTPRPFQFTLRRMFIAVAYFSAGFAVASVVLRVWQSQTNHPSLWQVFGAFFGPFAVFALMGAGVGHLAGDAKHGAWYGIATGAVLFVLYAIQQGLASMFK